MTQTHSQTATGDALLAKTLTAGDREELRRSFATDGYVVLKNVVPKDKLPSLAGSIVGAFERAKASGGLFSGGGLISGHLNCFPGESSRFAYEALREHGIIDLVKEITPRAFTTHSVRCNVNLPKSVTQHYHIDGMFIEWFTVVNVALVDTDLVNGAIELIPRTHREFYQYWRFALERPYRFAERIPMRAGDVLVRASNLWHRGMPNRSPNPRPMLAFTFGDRHEMELPDPFRANDGQIAFYENWYRPTRLGRLRERTFVAAPITYAAYRIVSSLIGNKGYGTP